MSPIVIRIVLVVYLVYGVICTDIDLQTCIDNFNVHRDKIIRTQDSQNMGAKYLNEIDLGSREECLRLCCETENCDVFVFEEKNSGSCYLFHCGPPEDFKCKFTHHVNYSSAVLSINRHLPDLESQIKLTKHEQDLTKLRKIESETDVLQLAVTDEKIPFTATTTTVAPKEILPLRKSKVEEDPAPVSALSNSAASPKSKCSRFQFECRGGNGECIAIYNACDGVPQCADGSDEAPELGCPDLMAGNAPPINTQAPPSRAEAQAQRSGLKIQPVYDGGVPNMIQPGSPVVMPRQEVIPPYQPAAPVPYPNSFQQVPQDFIRPEPKQVFRAPYEPPPYVAEQTLQQQWMPHQPNQVLPQQQQTQVQYPVGKNSRMFSHKENSIQMQDGHELNQMQFGDPSISDYSKLNGGGGYYGDNYRQPIQQENWPPDVNGYNNQGFYQDKVHQIDELPRKNPIYNSQPIEMPGIKQDTVNPKHVQEKLAHDLKHSKDNMEHGIVIEKKPKIEKHHRDQYPDVVAIRIDENDLQDGIAHTPRGAVLSVTFGLIITFVMAVMIVCRLRMVKRRIRKGGKSYAHDADFLVNGMYL